MDLNANVYQVKDYGMLLLVVLSTVIVIVALMSIVSAFAKSVKEASTYLSPLMILSMLVAASTMSDSFWPSNDLMYLIPIYNSANCLREVLSFAWNIKEILITVASNLVYAGIFAVILTKMFNSEKAMFSK
ncbi:hypothetical protein FACS1894111_13230 [Clostridia bacterium]|nr:hypothetical protein FACS1894111_13230 [Clostridia bacterium]